MNGGRVGTVAFVAAVCSLVPYSTAQTPENQPSKNASVTGVRFWSFQDATRIVIETSGEFEFRADWAKNPDRLFFDIFGARMRLGKKGVQTVSVNDRLLRQIRVAETVPGVTRVVFDIAGPVEHVASRLSNPDRLIVELRAGSTVSSAGPAEPGQRTSTELPAALPVTRVPAAQLPATQPPLAPVASSKQLPERSPVPETLAKPSSIPAPVPATSSATAPSSSVASRVASKPASLPAARTEAQAREDLKAAPPPLVLPKQSVKANRIPPPLTAPKPARLGENHSLTRILGLKIGRIVLDAGHGGHDTGTCGPDGLYEKDLVLDVTQRLGALIETKMGAEVIYTRSDDTFVPLERRTQMANEKRADLFLSIHANSSPESSASGVETYYLNFTSSEAAMEVAARENASSQRSVYELRDLLQKIALQDKIDESKEFASSIQSGLYSASVRANSRTKNRGVKKAPFVVLIGASMPSVLAEIGFVSNPKDEALLRKSEVRQKIAEGLLKGLQKYAASLSRFEVAARN